jgi:hypothetical protein
MSHLTVFLARLIGLFIMVLAVWVLVDQSDFSAVVQAVVSDRPATLLLSLMCLAAGLAVVLAHQVWSGGIAQILVTLLGWLLLVRGVVLLFLPQNLLETLATAVVGAGWLWLIGAIALILGIILTYAGFRAPPIVSSGK